MIPKCLLLDGGYDPATTGRTPTRAHLSPDSYCHIVVVDHNGEFVWTQENNYFGWRSLLGEEPGSADVSPYVAPAQAADVSGLPPTYISVGGLDLFAEENMTYADRLSRAGCRSSFTIRGRITASIGQRMPA